jgi:hypothetical protein
MVQISKIGGGFLGTCLSWLTFCSAAFGGNQGALSGSQQVTLGWTASSDPMVVGYYLYYGTATGVYANKIDVGTNTVFTVSGLVAGTTNYFTATSYYATRVESAYVPEVSYIVPGILTVTQNPTNAIMRVGFPVAPGNSYQLQASSDLNTWSNIWLTPTQTTNEWIEYDEPCTNTLSARFYRLMVYP